MVANLTVGFLGSSMPENRQVQSNAVPNASNSSPDHIDEAIRRLNIQSNDNQEEVYPERPGEPDCIYYLRTGLCGYGSNCRFNHPVYTGQVIMFIYSALKLFLLVASIGGNGFKMEEKPLYYQPSVVSSFPFHEDYYISVLMVSLHS